MTDEQPTAEPTDDVEAHAKDPAEKKFEPAEDVEAILAGNIYQRRIVLGARDDRCAGGAARGLVGRVRRRGIGRQAPRQRDIHSRYWRRCARRQWCEGLLCRH